MPYQIYILGLIGTFAFSVFGAHKGIEKKFDIFGVFVSAFLTSFAGGTAVDIILNKTPDFFSDNNYILITVIGAIFAITFFNLLPKISKYILFIDAIGLVTFAFVGATKAANEGFGLVGTILLSTTMAVGGGLIRDVVIRDVPQILFKDFYASPAIILGTIFYLSDQYQDSEFFIYSLLATALLIRLLAIYLNLNIWRPWNNKQS